MRNQNPPLARWSAPAPDLPEVGDHGAKHGAELDAAEEVHERRIALQHHGRAASTAVVDQHIDFVAGEMLGGGRWSTTPPVSPIGGFRHRPEVVQMLPEYRLSPE